MQVHSSHMSRIVRKPEFCLCENKGADQLRSNCEADQRLCFSYTDSTISLLLKSEISSFYPAFMTAQVGLCQTWSEAPKTGFLASRLICVKIALRQFFFPDKDHYDPHCETSRFFTSTKLEDLDQLRISTISYVQNKHVFCSI